MNDFENCRQCGKERICNRDELCPQCERNGERKMTSPAEARAYLNAHRPPALDSQSGSSSSARAVRDPFAHTSHTEDYYHPSVANSARVPRYRGPNGAAPLPIELQPSATDSNRYEAWQRDQRLQLDMALAVAEKAHANDRESFRELARQDPRLVDKAGDAPNPIPPQSEAEENERAMAAARKLAALGYQLHKVAMGSFIVDAGGNRLGEFAYVIARVNGPYMSKELVGNLRSVEGFTWNAEREEAEKQTALKRLREQPPKPMISLGPVQVAPYGSDFETQATLDKRAMRAELKRELLEELKGDAAA